MSTDAISAVVQLFGEIAVPAFSVAFVFAFGAKLVRSLLNMGFDGKFKL